MDRGGRNLLYCPLVRAWCWLSGEFAWFFNADHTECVVRERYRDSEAVLEHVANLGETVEALLAVCDLEVEYFGAPTEELLTATAEFAPRVYSAYQSI